jgi:hypothetical protein
VKETENPSPIKSNPEALRGLIEDCLSGRPEAWNLFFKTFTGHIKGYIRTALIGKNEFGLAADTETIRQIYLEVANKLFLDNGLAQIGEQDKRGRIGVILAWLKTTSQRKTLDHLTRRRTQKNLPARQAERSTSSLDQPVALDKSEITGHDVIGRAFPLPEDRPPQPQSIDQLFATAKESLTDLDWWILRLKLVFADPLSRQEIKQLAKFTERDQNVVAKQVDLLMEIMTRRQAREETAVANVARLLAVLHRYQYQLTELGPENRPGEPSREELEEKIANTARKIREQQATLNTPLLAANRDIAELLGLGKKDQIAIKWLRVKQKLRRNSDLFRGWTESGLSRPGTTAPLATVQTGK